MKLYFKYYTQMKTGNDTIHFFTFHIFRRLVAMLYCHTVNNTVYCPFVVIGKKAINEVQKHYGINRR